MKSVQNADPDSPGSAKVRPTNPEQTREDTGSGPIVGWGQISVRLCMVGIVQDSYRFEVQRSNVKGQINLDNKDIICYDKYIINILYVNYQ